MRSVPSTSAAPPPALKYEKKDMKKKKVVLPAFAEKKCCDGPCREGCSEKSQDPIGQNQLNIQMFSPVDNNCQECVQKER